MAKFRKNISQKAIFANEPKLYEIYICSLNLIHTDPKVWSCILDNINCETKKILHEMSKLSKITIFLISTDPFV
jgi:hypothetical protein